MHYLQISFLFSIIISIHAQNLHKKSYQEHSLYLNKSIHIINIIRNHLLWQSASNGAKDNNWKLRDFDADIERKWKEQSNQKRRDKKKGLMISKLEEQNQNSVQSQISGNLPCTIPKWVNQTEIGKSLSIFFSNPCHPDPKRPCKFIYKNFISKKKFIQCDKSGKALVKSCPQYSKWDNTLRKCSYSYIELITSCPLPSWVNQNETGSNLPPYYVNPCPQNNKRKCDFIYLRYKLNGNKFIQCDRLGNAIIKSCPPSSKWDKNYKQCSLKTTIIKTSTEEYKETTIAGGTVPSTVTSTEEYQDSTVVESTGSNLNITNETEHPCSIPFWVDKTDNGTKLPGFYVNPCTPKSNGLCKFTYKQYEIDETKFIQCERSGNALIKSCPTSFTWDKDNEQCSLKTSMIITSTEEYQDSTVVESTGSNLNITNETEHPCSIPFWVDKTDNGTKLPGFYVNPCTPKSNGLCKFTYKQYEIDETKFIQCERSGNALIKSCPTSFTWDKDNEQCSLKTSMIITSTEEYQDSTVVESTGSNLNITNETEHPCSIPFWVDKTDNGTKLPGFYVNPCTPKSNGLCKFTYKQYEIDETKFIQCERSGNALIKSCPTSFTWDKDNEQCSLKTSMIITSTEEYQDSTVVESTGSNLNITNETEHPCSIPFWVDKTDNGTKLPGFYVNPCTPKSNGLCKFTYKQYEIDETKFIQCERSGNALIKSCPTSFTWDKDNEQCSLKTSMIITSTEEYQDSTVVESTGSNLNITNETEHPCSIPFWVDKTDNGTKLPGFYVNPCTPKSNGLCKFTYKQYEIDETKFIQCERSGNALIKSCPTSFTWDNIVEQCSPEVVSTTEFPCPIPSGVDQTQKASILPLVYPNPCTADPSRACKFSFMPYLLVPHKFIQCDRFGKASVRSCQQSFMWFQTVQQCLPQIRTTSPQQCEIPVWVNENEQGLTLPQYYPNPCIADLSRVCLFVYKPFVLDEHKFILCNKNGHALIKTCPPNSKWIVDARKCSKPQCEIPNWVNEKEKGILLKPHYPNPCPVDIYRNCEFIYLLYILDQYKFIQCDKYGNAIIKSCPPSSIWDNHMHQCSIMTTLRPACAIPKWMNPNEKGLPLSSNLPNPCIETTQLTCKYFAYVLNDQHFIECDEYGKAWVKTCPPKSKWDNTFKKCTA